MRYIDHPGYFQRNLRVWTANAGQKNKDSATGKDKEVRDFGRVIVAQLLRFATCEQSQSKSQSLQSHALGDP